MGQFDALGCPRGPGGVHDRGQIIGPSRADAFGQVAVADGHAKAFEDAERIGIEHERAGEAGAVVGDAGDAVVALAVVDEHELDLGVVDDALGLGGGVGVVNRHGDGTDGRQGEVEHTPFVARGGEDRDGVAAGDPQGHEAL